jgi:hypothetical protein
MAFALPAMASLPPSRQLLQAFYANAIPLELLKTEQDRIGIAEYAAKDEPGRRRTTSRAGRMFFERPSGSPATATPHI